MLPPFDPWFTGTACADAWAAAHGSVAAVAARQARRLRELLLALKGSRLYRGYLDPHDPGRTPLSSLPIARRPELMRRFDEWVTDPALKLGELQRFIADRSRIAEPYLGRYMVWESSGSAGQPGVFVQDAAAMAVYDALEGWRRPSPPAWQPWAAPWLASQRMAFVGATGGHFASIVSLERLRRLNPALAHNIHCLSFLQPLGQLAGALQAMQPDVLASYPSEALLLAEEQRAGRLRLGLREVWTGGETLTAAMRQGIEAAFGCPVHNSYGASEFLAMASECAHGRLHLNSDWLILEPIDDRGQPVPPGRPSATTLLTNLANCVQPVIRYDLGDRVTLASERCACGCPLPVIDVQGRRDDTLQLPGMHRRLVSVLPLAISTVLEDDAGLFDFQLRQQGPSELLLCTGQRGACATRQLRDARLALARFLAAQGAAPVRIRCRSGEPGRRGRSGKIPRVVAGGQ